MVFIPFVFFTALTAYWWHKHRKLDVCVYMAGLYTISMLCCLIVLMSNLTGDYGILFDQYDMQLNIVPTITFCLLLGLGMLPFSMLYTSEIKKITNPCPWVIDGLSWMLILAFLVNLYLIYDSTADILNGNLEAVRQAHYEGLESPAELKAMTMPAVMRYIYSLNVATLLALPLFFYNVCFREKPWWFNTLLFITSLSNPIAGIQAADRTEFVFYSMMFIYCLIFFGPRLSRRFKRGLVITGTPIAVLIVTYIVAVSIARFETSTNSTSGGASGGIVAYAGQSYLNYCFFWERAKTDQIAIERTLPMTSHVLLKTDNNSIRRAERSGHQGFFISVFATYIGDILLDLTPVGMITWVLLYFMLCMLVIGRAHRTEIHIGECLAIFVLAAIPIFGIFYYRYMSRYNTFMNLLVVAVYLYAEWIQKGERLKERLHGR